MRESLVSRIKTDGQGTKPTSMQKFRRGGQRTQLGEASSSGVGPPTSIVDNIIYASIRWAYSESEGKHDFPYSFDTQINNYRFAILHTRNK